MNQKFDIRKIINELMMVKTASNTKEIKPVVDKYVTKVFSGIKLYFK
jgi:hypothetical protein